MDDNDDFFPDDIDPEEEAEYRKQRELEKKNSKALFDKAKGILQTVESLRATLEKEEESEYISTLMESALIIPAKIAGASGSGNWHIYMQNASLIRYHAEYLLVSCHGLREFTSAEESYIKVFRREMEEFRDLFREWVKTFDQLERDDYEDDWGLFVRK